MWTRRAMVQALASLPLFGHATLAAQTAKRVGGARLVVIDGRVWMQVRFGARGPYTFIVDTGTFVNLIRRDVARELRLFERGQIGVRGLGGRPMMTHYEARDVMLGNINIGGADFAAYEQKDLPIHREAAGALSASILTAADADLDFEAREWRIYPDGRGTRDGFERLPSTFTRPGPRGGAPHILVDTKIDGRTYRLTVDTGAPGQILLDAGATRRIGLWNDTTPFSPHARHGIGGEGGRARLVRVGELSIGGIRFERPLVSLTQPGAYDGESDGLIGLALLETLNLSTEVATRTLWAKRNTLPLRPERYGLSGLWVDDRKDHLLVEVVSPKSPAAEAGLQVGDEIVGIPFSRFVATLGGRLGDAIEIRYRRRGQTASTRLTLRDYL